MKYTLLTLAIFLSLLSTPSHAGDIDAIKAAASKRYTVPATSPIARQIVEWYALSQSDTVRFDRAHKFLQTHKDWPSIGAIQINAEKSITSSVPTATVLHYFKEFPPISATGMKHYLGALMSQHKTQKALSILKNWWIDASLTPNEQKEFMAQFGKYLGTQDHERRLRKIIHDKYYTNARALAVKLGNGYPQLVEAKISLIEQKSDVNKRIAAVPANLKNNEALQLARLQWRRKNNEDAGAIDLLRNAPTANRLSTPHDWWRERHIMIRRLMEQKKWGSAYALASNHRQKNGFSYAQAEFVAGWLALRKIGKPWEAFEHFERLFNAVESPISRARGAYWAGLASDALKHPEIAVQWYQVAAKYQTTYYGQMAAGRINLPLGLVNPTPIRVTPTARAQFKSSPLISAALMLRQAGQRSDTKQFIYAYNDTNPNGLKYSLSAQLATSFGMHDAALRIAKNAERDGYIMPQYLFPVLKEASTGRYAVHPAFIHGIIRQESAFDQYAESHSGAQGLMQLMPPTAKEAAEKIGIPYSKSKLKSDPQFNMTLGAFYINEMLNRWDGNRTLAIASYNAGPGRVGGFLDVIGDPRDKNVDEVDWIETIPIYETRNYVQRVTEAVNVYARLLK